MKYAFMCHCDPRRGVAIPSLVRKIASGKALAMTMTGNYNFVIPSVLSFDLPKSFLPLIAVNLSPTVSFKGEE